MEAGCSRRHLGNRSPVFCDHDKFSGLGHFIKKREALGFKVGSCDIYHMTSLSDRSSKINKQPVWVKWRLRKPQPTTD